MEAAGETAGGGAAVFERWASVAGGGPEAVGRVMACWDSTLADAGAGGGCAPELLQAQLLDLMGQMFSSGPAVAAVWHEAGCHLLRCVFSEPCATAVSVGEQAMQMWLRMARGVPEEQMAEQMGERGGPTKLCQTLSFAPRSVTGLHALTPWVKSRHAINVLSAPRSGLPAATGGKGCLNRAIL